ncbi:distal tail protein Dit [Hathewaya histolytica]|uniref:Phage tail protein n=1 Tax=Hathewaya histolytica TaxID=1498 RepID=A0A4U9R7J2_HATHI|nr:distal tail protein Dit [Hathewaya histolytica]VTQ87026.1 phage tail protein [Hathewaya histolytica]
METGFIWKGIHSSEKGLKIISLPNISTPEERVEKIVVPGRNGYLTTDDNTYEGEVKTVEFDIKHNNFDDMKQWLNGSGEVIFSNEMDRYYKARIVNKVDLIRVLEKFHSGVVQFDCQPFGYLKDESNIFKIIDYKFSRDSKSINPLESLNYSGGTVYKENESITLYKELAAKQIIINNTGTIYSEPTITICGTGDITIYINEETIKLKNVEDKITINSEMMECYKNTMPCNNKMYGEFPRFEVGENNISWEGDIKTIDIKKNTRFL